MCLVACQSISMGDPMCHAKVTKARGTRLEDDCSGSHRNLDRQNGERFPADGGDVRVRAVVAHHAVLPARNALDLLLHRSNELDHRAHDQDPQNEVPEESPQPAGGDHLGPVGLGVDPAHHRVAMVEPVGDARVGRAVPDDRLHEEEERLAEPVGPLREYRLVLQLVRDGHPESVEEVVDIEDG